MKLQRYERDGLVLLVDNETGATYASIRMTARLIDKDAICVRRYIESKSKGGTNDVFLEVTINTPGGKQGGTVLNETQILEVIQKHKPDLLMKF